MNEEHIDQKEKMAAIGARIDSVRVELDLKKVEMAAVMGFHYTYLSKILKGEKKVNVEHVTKLYNAYNISPNFILLGIGEMFVDLKGRGENSEKAGRWVQGQVDALSDRTVKDVKFARKVANAYARFVEGDELKL